MLRIVSTMRIEVLTLLSKFSLKTLRAVSDFKCLLKHSVYNGVYLSREIKN